MSRGAEEYEGTAEEIADAAAPNGDALPVIAEVRALEPARPGPWHASLIRLARNQPPAPTAFGKSLKGPAVLKIVRPFIKG